MIGHQKDKYSWSFVFIGANINAFTTADTYGIDRGYTINYSQSGFGQANAFKSLSRGLAATRICESMGVPLTNFFENELSPEYVAYNKLDTLDIGATIKKYTNGMTTTATPPQDTSAKSTV